MKQLSEIENVIKYNKIYEAFNNFHIKYYQEVCSDIYNDLIKITTPIEDRYKFYLSKLFDFYILYLGYSDKNYYFEYVHKLNKTFTIFDLFIVPLTNGEFINKKITFKCNKYKLINKETKEENLVFTRCNSLNIIKLFNGERIKFFESENWI